MYNVTCYFKHHGRVWSTRPFKTKKKSKHRLLLYKVCDIRDVHSKYTLAHKIPQGDFPRDTTKEKSCLHRILSPYIAKNAAMADLRHKLRKYKTYLQAHPNGGKV